MKLRLHKSLLAAVVATFAILDAGATIEISQPQTITGDYTANEQVIVSTKLTIGKEKTETSFAITQSPESEDAFIVDGKDASVRMNNVTMNVIPSESQLWVGYSDNGGSMVVDKGSEIDISAATTLGIGVKGKGDLTIKGQSSFIGGYNNLWLWGGTLTLDEKSTLDACTSAKGWYNYRVLVGAYGDATINVLGGSELTTAATQFVTNHYYDGKVANINVDGIGSVLKQEAITNSGNGRNIGTSGVWEQRTEGNDRYWYDLGTNTEEPLKGDRGTATITYLCDSGSNNGRKYAWDIDNVTTNLRATNGGKMIFDSALAYVGFFTDRSEGLTNKLLNIYVDENPESSISFNRMEVYADMNITAAGGFIINGSPVWMDSNKNIGEQPEYAGMNIYKGATLTFNLTDANREKAVITLGPDADVKIKSVTESVTDDSIQDTADTVTFAIIAPKNLKAGNYILFSDDSVMDYAEDIVLKGVDSELTVLNGQTVITLMDDVIVMRDPLADVVQAANWGVYHSTQAFTSMLWTPHTNGVKLTSPGTDEKGIALPTQPVGYTLAWASVYSSFAEHCGSNGFADMDYSIVGGAVGVEHRCAGGSSIAIAFGYDWGKASPKGLNNVDQESMHAALYGRAFETSVSKKGKLALDWSAAVGQTESDHKLACCDWTQNSMQLDARLSYIHAVSERTAVNAFVGMQYYAQDDDSTDRIEADSMQNLRAQFGVGVSHQVCEKAVVFAEASVYRDIMRHNPTVNVDGIHYGSGANPGRTGGNITVGAEYTLTPNWTLRGSYGFEVADHLQQHNANVGAVYSF